MGSALPPRPWSANSWSSRSSTPGSTAMNGFTAIRPSVPLAGVQRHAVPLARDPHETGLALLSGHRVSPPEEPRAASLHAASASRNRWSSNPLRCRHRAASGRWGEETWRSAVERRMRRRVRCRCSRPDTRRCGRRASLQPPPAGVPVRRVVSAVVDPRHARPPAEASSVAGRLSRTRPGMPRHPVDSRDDALHHPPERRRRLRGPLSSVIPDLGPVASARHRCCIALPSSGPVHRQERPKSLSPSPGPSHGVSRAQHAHRSTWSSSLKARPRPGVRRPGAVRTATRGSGCRHRRARRPSRGMSIRKLGLSSARSPAWTVRGTVHGWPSHGVWCPTTLTETGSDLHRAYHTRLCCAFRLSQPLDALFRP
jgi:hypothetical protein